MTGRVVVVVECRGHEPGWLEPKQTAGVETWLWQQVQLRSSGVYLGIIIITMNIYKVLSMFQSPCGQ